MVGFITPLLLVLLRDKTIFTMKTKLFLFAIPCVILVACNGSADKTDKKMADSLAAKAHMDSLLNAAKMTHKQDSMDAAKSADSAKKADSAKGKK